ncbi:response regulator [Kribbella antibiotica]|uniref:Response regulator n=1 Tax=Kribbella antibiotica TaxID=190195 RepID=A0A4R4ZT82_9ACTN|nr:response regulator [Kribbella antibiotica]TDD61496.1 response regulator [Kribbella antibiotica]
MSDQPTYSIGALACILGVSMTTLRTWEVRYPVVVPPRSPDGQRAYSKAQVRQLRFVCDQLAIGKTWSAAFRLLEDHLAGEVPLPVASVVLAGVPARILLVDPDSHAASFSEYFLHEQGHEVTVASTVDQAVAEVRSVTPALAVVDLLVSGGQGMLFCRQLRQELGIPVLAVSTKNLRADAAGVGAAGFLIKPIQSQRLASVVQHLLSPRAPTAARRRLTSDGVAADRDVCPRN